MGQTNIDKGTGIRYGVISSGEVTQAWSDSSEADYGEPHCHKCGNEAVGSSDEVDAEVLKELCQDMDTETANAFAEQDRKSMGWERDRGHYGDYACDSCRYLFDGDEAFGDEPQAWYVGTIGEDGKLQPDSEGYMATQGGSDHDIFVLKSPYYTYAEWCSPCAPGAAYLMSPTEKDGGPKAYCFGHDWFEGGKAPYPVYRVDNDELVED